MESESPSEAKRGMNDGVLCGLDKGGALADRFSYRQFGKDNFATVSGDVQKEMGGLVSNRQIRTTKRSSKVCS